MHLCSFKTSNYHCVTEKSHPFYICDSLVRCHPILPILGRNVPQGIGNKQVVGIVSSTLASKWTVPATNLPATIVASVTTLNSESPQFGTCRNLYLFKLS